MAHDRDDEAIQQFAEDVQQMVRDSGRYTDVDMLSVGGGTDDEGQEFELRITDSRGRDVRVRVD